MILILVLGLLLQSAAPQDITQLTQRAEAGDAKAEYALGLDYARGSGVQADDAQALKWFLKSAQQHYAAGEYALSELYMTGRGVAENDAKALEWMKLAAEHGDPRAQYNLAALYLAGRGVTKDESVAFTWMDKAARQGFTDGEFGLGSMYHNGTGVQRNDAEAMRWYRSSARHGSDDAANNLALLLATSPDPKVRNEQEALKTAQDVVQHHLGEDPYLHTLAEVYFAQGDAKAAVETEKRALAIKPDSELYKSALAKYEKAAQPQR
jgi:uncharacterized protein